MLSPLHIWSYVTFIIALYRRGNCEGRWEVKYSGWSLAASNGRPSSDGCTACHWSIVPPGWSEHTRFHDLFVFLPHKHTSVALRCLTALFTWHRLAGTNYKKCSVLQGIGKTITLFPQAIFLSYCSSLFDCGIVGLFFLFCFSYLLKFSLFLIRA